MADMSMNASGSSAGSLDQVRLAAARALARAAHYGQTDKAGLPYVTHPQRVAGSLEDSTAQIVALLHDTLEDTMLTEEDLRPVFGDEITDAVVAMTHLETESYMEYVHRLGANALARRVKLADLKDNMRRDRLPVIRPEDEERLRRYEEAKAYLESLDT